VSPLLEPENEKLALNAAAEIVEGGIETGKAQSLCPIPETGKTGATKQEATAWQKRHMKMEAGRRSVSSPSQEGKERSRLVGKSIPSNLRHGNCKNMPGEGLLPVGWTGIGPKDLADENKRRQGGRLVITKISV